LYPIGSFEGHDWFAAWNRGETLYLQRGYEWSDQPMQRYQATGFAAAYDAAIEGTPIERLDTGALPEIAVREVGEYPGMTRWSLYGDDTDPEFEAWYRDEYGDDDEDDDDGGGEDFDA
jgi:hypothetical protein